MNRFLLILIACTMCIMTHAQEIGVISFEKSQMDLSARIYPRKDLNDQPCALVKVQLTLDEVVFGGNIVGETVRDVNEYLVYMTAGSKMLTIRHPKYMTLTVRFTDYDIAALEPSTTYALKLRPEVIQERIVVVDTITVPTASIIIGANTEAQPNSSATPTNELKTAKSVDEPVKPTNIYTGASFQAGSWMGIGATIGINIHHVNLEATALYGLTSSEDIAWKQTEDKSQSGYTYTYAPLYYGVKIGYEVGIGRNLTLTPQLGVGLISISGTQAAKGNGTDPAATSCYTVPVSAGIRLALNIGTHFGISVSPEYGFAVMESDTFAKLKEVSSTVSGFGSGFNVRAGLYVCF